MSIPLKVILSKFTMRIPFQIPPHPLLVKWEWRDFLTELCNVCCNCCNSSELYYIGVQGLCKERLKIAAGNL